MDYIKIITSQTTYTEKEADELLKQNNNDYMKILKDFMAEGKNITKEEPKLPYHQLKISLLREALDDANERYRIKKEQKELAEQNTC